MHNEILAAEGKEQTIRENPANRMNHSAPSGQ